MLGLSRTKTVRVEQTSNQANGARIEQLTDEIARLSVRIEIADQKTLEAADALKAVQQDFEAGQVALAGYRRRTEDGTRVGYIRIDTARLQAKMRNLVSSVKVEGPMEPQVWVIKAAEDISEGDLHATQAAIHAALTLDRT